MNPFFRFPLRSFRHDNPVAGNRLSPPLRAVIALLLVFIAALDCGFAPQACAKGSGPKLPHPGFRSIGLWDPDIPIRMDIAVWYPTARQPRAIQLNGWSIRVGLNGTPTPGKYPVILLSHTTAGTRLASHDLAANLARNGFMVISPTHPLDNADDTSGIYSAGIFADRPRQMLLALDAVEKNAALRNVMDRNRIGVLGAGAGAATALQLAGALPDFSLLDAHCEPVTMIPPTDPYCSQWAKLLHPRMRAEFTTLLAGGQEKFTPTIVPEKAPLLPDVSLNALANAPSTPALTEASAPAQPPVQESRDGTAPEVAELPAPMPQTAEEAPQRPQPVLAVGLLTPGLVDLFPDEALRGIAAPVGILAVEKDAAYPLEKTLSRLQRALPQRPASRVLQHAGHSDVQAPCPPMYTESFSELCGNQSSSSEELRRIRNEFFVRFFQKNLGLPGPPPPAPPK